MLTLAKCGLNTLLCTKLEIELKGDLSTLSLMPSMVATAHMLAETLQDCKTPTLYSRHLLIMEVILRIPTHMQADTRAPKIAEVLRQLQ